jgi:formylglycine-generating enzyme required for sulfatase activity
LSISGNLFLVLNIKARQGFSMNTISSVTIFNAAGVTFCEIPEGDATIGDMKLGQMPEPHHVTKFALAQKPGANYQLDDYSHRMGRLTHGRVARRLSDGRPFVVERTRANGRGSQPGAEVIAFDESSSVLVDGGRLVRLVPDPNRYVTELGERAANSIGPHLPAAFVTPLEALGWADFLAQESGRDVTLPTNIQWQYAAQGGQGHRYAPRGRLDPREVIYQHDGKRQGPAPLNREGWEQLLNPFGLLDMTGNVWEPTLFEGPVTPEMAFMIRWSGGSWDGGFAHRLLVASGYLNDLDDAYFNDGVRPAVALE